MADNQDLYNPAAQAAASVAAGGGAPFQIKDMTGSTSGFFNFGQLQNPNALVVHHTGGHPSVEGVIQTYKDRNFPAQFIIDRSGNVIRALPETSRGQHTKPSEDSDLDINNSNSWGVEIIANDDKDVTPAQKAAALNLTTYLHDTYGLPTNRVVGHGHINSHKQSDEGNSVIQALRDSGAQVAAYADHPVPPGELPEVGTALDTTRAAPNPVSQSPMLSAQRTSTSPNGNNNALQQALNQIATTKANAVTPVMRRPVLPPMGTPNVNSIYEGIYPQQSVMRSIIPKSQIGEGFQRSPMLPAMGTPNVSSLYAGIYPQQSTMRPAQSASDLSHGQTTMIPAKGSLLQPGAIAQSVQSAGSVQNPALAAALARSVATPKQVPQSQIERTSPPIPQSQIERTALPRNVPPDLISESMQRIASANPTKLPAIPKSPAVGQPPTTRVVKSAPIPAVAPAIDVKPQASFSASDMARGKTPSVPAAAPYKGPFVPTSAIDRLPAFAGLDVAPVQTNQQPYVKPTTQPMQGGPQAPIPASMTARDIARNGSWSGNVFTPPQRPITSAELAAWAPNSPMIAAPRPVARAPVMRAPVSRPLQIEVSGAQVMQPAISEIDRLRAMGMSPQQAYDALNSSRGGIGYSDAANRVNGSNSRGSGGARSLLD